ncbi:hypothetical protein [Streptomyces sp. NPDC059893]|uniref:hypothetical protein n=1 Tax=Streptomyces sp. NPDC059893 TaxID=3346990 RepID=UPI00366457A6
MRNIDFPDAFSHVALSLTQCGKHLAKFAVCRLGPFVDEEIFHHSEPVIALVDATAKTVGYHERGKPTDPLGMVVRGPLQLLRAIEDLLCLTVELCIPGRVPGPRLSVSISVPPNPLRDALSTDDKEIGDRSVKLLQVVEFEGLAPICEHALPLGVAS